MSPLIDSFMLPGYPGNEVQDSHPAASINGGQAPVAAAYQIPPVVWMIVFLVVGMLMLIWLLGRVE